MPRSCSQVCMVAAFTPFADGADRPGIPGGVWPGGRERPPGRLVLAEAVLVERGHRDGDPAAVPAVSHLRRCFRGVDDALRPQERIVIRHVLRVQRVTAYPDPVAG